MSRAPRICYAGTYDRHYPRNRLMVRALRDAGATVEEAHAALVDVGNDNAGVGVGSVARLGLRAALAYARLVPEVSLRLLRCDALGLGYIGQLDALVLGPLAKLQGKPVIFNPLVTLTDSLVEDRRRFAPGSLTARLLAALDRAALGMADVVIVDTVENGEFLTRHFAIPADAIVVVPVGADERWFAPGAAKPTGAPLDVVFIGKFIPLHGIETIVRAAALIADRGLPMRIELVGTGQTYAAMRQLADRLGVGPSTLTWIDWIPFGIGLDGPWVGMRRIGDDLFRVENRYA